MQFLLLTALLTTASALALPQTAPCTQTQVDANILTPFAITFAAIDPASAPAEAGLPAALHTWQAGGGDLHVFAAPAGNLTTINTLIDGVIHNHNEFFDLDKGGQTLRAVVNGEYTPHDNTTKIFMTERGDPRGYFDVYEDSCTLERELRIRDGANTCLRLASGPRWELRWSGFGNTLSQDCVNVKLLVAAAAEEPEVPEPEVPEPETPEPETPEPETPEPETPEPETPEPEVPEPEVPAKW